MLSDLRFCGANERTRTADLRITSALLYQLSHIGKSTFSSADTQYNADAWPLQLVIMCSELAIDRCLCFRPRMLQVY